MSSRTGPTLALAGSYRRQVGASLARIWENVHDWEHLAHLHDGSFAACALLDRGAWGWRARLVLAGGDAQVIELRADREGDRYVSTTLEGTGAGTEIRVALAPVEPHVTDVAVEFHIPETRPERLAAIGAAYARAYERLWDEDEAMMRTRERMLSAPRPATDAPATVDLGEEAAVRARLPLAFEMAARPFRLIEIDGSFVAHSTVCPHWLGPLDGSAVMDGAVRCPWHGYRFDAASGRRLDRPGFKLATAPRVAVVAGRVIATGSGRA